MEAMSTTPDTPNSGGGSDKGSSTARKCGNCSTEKSSCWAYSKLDPPGWRCHTCRVYEYNHGRLRPAHLYNRTKRSERVCGNCGVTGPYNRHRSKLTQDMNFWICHACYVFENTHGKSRPAYLFSWNRGAQNTSQAAGLHTTKAKGTGASPIPATNDPQSMWVEAVGAAEPRRSSDSVLLRRSSLASANNFLAASTDELTTQPTFSAPLLLRSNSYTDSDGNYHPPTYTGAHHPSCHCMKCLLGRQEAQAKAQAQAQAKAQQKQQQNENARLLSFDSLQSMGLTPASLARTANTPGQMLQTAQSTNAYSVGFPNVSDIQQDGWATQQPITVALRGSATGDAYLTGMGGNASSAMSLAQTIDVFGQQTRQRSSTTNVELEQMLTTQQQQQLRTQRAIQQQQQLQQQQQQLQQQQLLQRHQRQMRLQQQQQTLAQPQSTQSTGPEMAVQTLHPQITQQQLTDAQYQYELLYGRALDAHPSWERDRTFASATNQDTSGASFFAKRVQQRDLGGLDGLAALDEVKLWQARQM
eukprot:comp23681_c0_seq1/m.40572 comp23681_c0_seq1/g.40572  ORF comp23681_c0_seq1/g.40572 comp23681_c0_seq1/m.40572 type:complete len:528 (-) comp23681_c0_seq1:846-2429(-)